MNLGKGKFLLLATLFLFVVSVAGWGAPTQIYSQPWDGGSNLFASQNDTNPGGLGNYATTYDTFTLSQTWNVESFHWVGGYFNPPSQGTITAWTLTFYANNGGVPGSPIALGSFSGNGSETFIGIVNGFPIYDYSLTFSSFDMGPGTYWASVVPDLGFPPEWGWATGTGPDLGYQCFFGTCGPTGTSFAFALDGTAVTATPEPGTLVLLGTGVLGLAGAIRRKLV